MDKTMTMSPDTMPGNKALARAPGRLSACELAIDPHMRGQLVLLLAL
jgi:hypothetical protein